MRLRLLTLGLLAAFVLGACSGGAKQGPSTAPGSSARPAPVPPKPVLCPLTGLEVAAGIDVNRPALAVKIDNAPPARPQAGPDKADIVYEEIGEGGLTRLLSIFQCSDAGSLGPIRSARTVDPDVLLEYAPALFGYSGANSQVLKKVASTNGVIDLKQGSNGAAYSRESSRRAPYNLFSSSAKLRDLPAARSVKGPPRPEFEYDPALLNPQPPPPPPTAGAVAPPAPAGSSVAFSYSGSTNIRYTFDPARKAYLRFHGDVPHKVSSGEQIAVVNVVILKVKVAPGQVKDASGSPTQDTTVTGSGEAFILRGGVAVPGRWSRPDLSSKMTLTGTSGEPVKLAPGNTWIHLVPSDRAVTVQ